jgi:integrase
MASISTDPAGNRTIQFIGSDRKRRSIRLGKVRRMKNVETICDRVEELVAARLSGKSPKPSVVEWLDEITDDLHTKLAAVGLVERRGGASDTLGNFLDQYIAIRRDVRPNTLRNMKQSRGYLVNHFGTNRKLGNITGGDADAFGHAMHAKYAEATSARVIKHARQFFKAAVRSKLLRVNPFLEVKAGSMENDERLHFVSPQDAEKLLAAAPSLEWRVIIALARWGGLRTPSEHLALTWADVDWDRNRFLVQASKTKARWVPLFPELRPILEEAFDAAEAGSVYVVTKTRDAGSNWRTTFEKIIRRAGLLPWDRPFQNLRASRETELAAIHPLHVVTKWIGNSARVAQKHYLQVTDADFERAAQGGAESGAVVVQNPVQTVLNCTRQESTDLAPKGKREDDLRPVPSTAVDYRTHEEIPLTGVEPVF